MTRIIHVVLNSATLRWLTGHLVRRTFLKFSLAFQCRGESRPAFMNNPGMREGDNLQREITLRPARRRRIVLINATHRLAEWHLVHLGLSSKLCRAFQCPATHDYAGRYMAMLPPCGLFFAAAILLTVRHPSPTILNFSPGPFCSSAGTRIISAELQSSSVSTDREVVRRSLHRLAHRGRLQALRRQGHRVDGIEPVLAGSQSEW